MIRIRPSKNNSPTGLFSVWPMLLCLVTVSVSAAEVRGRIWDSSTGAAPSDGRLENNCGGTPKSHPLVGNGSYSIRNIPNGSCTLNVITSYGSAARTITVNKPVVQFNSEIRRAGNRIFLVPR